MVYSRGTNHYFASSHVFVGEAGVNTKSYCQSSAGRLPDASKDQQTMDNHYPSISNHRKIRTFLDYKKDFGRCILSIKDFVISIINPEKALFLSEHFFFDQ
ncbi:hypothetical protein [Marinomonas sp. 2405UD68-3]|uniref:hypothetical protein n=1 Tax=Marinomonas sp. 2405UD68-3 TaxID=3391835 RepID=UPI0039C9B0AD